MENIIFGIHNQSFFDSYWTAVHFASGLLVGLLVFHYFKLKKNTLDARTYSRYGFILLLLWEYVEITLRYTNKYNTELADRLKSFLPDAFFELESLINITSDLIVGSIGLYLVYRYMRPRNSFKPSE